MINKTFKYIQPDIKYKNEFAFNQGRDAFKNKPDQMCPYRKWQPDHRDDWTSGYLYELRLHNQKLASKNDK